MLNNFHRFQPITLTSYYPTKTINLIKKENSSSKINVFNKNIKIIIIIIFVLIQ